MHIGQSEESNDAKYLSGISTLLVATIQEAKDRISQIEYIFCSQLYPNILQKIYSEARSAAQNEWKEKQSQLQLELKDKERLMKELEGKIDALNKELQEKNEEVTEQKVRITHAEQMLKRNGNAHHDLANQIELKTSELAAEKLKRRELHVRYKELKSQQRYLLKKFGVTNEEETNFTLSEIKSNVVACELNKVKQEISDDENIVRLDQLSNLKSLSGSDSPTRRKTRNSGSLAGGKRPVSGWRETRSHQCPGGDFLDTPYQDIRGNLHKTVKDNLGGVPAESPKDLDSDDETQDMKAEPAPKRQQLQAPRSSDGPKGFKYVEPVRKKAERESLKGVECKQCKKFYDAVLADADPKKGGEVDKQKLRCEHHDGVSRHRYRYAPPLTPEGFWNIGFDTES